MKTYRVEVVFTFSGTVDIKAKSKKEAIHIAQSDICAGLKDIYTENENIVKWNVDCHSLNTEFTGGIEEV